MVSCWLLSNLDARVGRVPVLGGCPTSRGMRTVVRVKLLPTPEQERALEETLARANHVANEVSIVAKERNIFRKYDLHKVCYGKTKELLSSAQMAVRTIHKVADAYKTHHANIRAGNRGKKGSKRRAKAEATIIQFRTHSAQPYDDRILSWKQDDQQVSIWVANKGDNKPGRIKVSYTSGPTQLQQLRNRKGESDLVCQGGKWFLVATIPHQTPTPTSIDGFIGVDLGINRLATLATNTEQELSFTDGRQIKDRKEHDRRLREHLQRVGTKSAKRKLKKRSRKESRYMRDVNHQISKQVIATAKRTGKGIALEDLTGIRDRVRHRKQQRPAMTSWSFRQLGDYITYKARLAGIPVVFVDPAYTSKGCHSCGHTHNKNRPTQELFACTKCGITMNADMNAAINIAKRGHKHWAEVNQPIAA